MCAQLTANFQNPRRQRYIVIRAFAKTKANILAISFPRLGLSSRDPMPISYSTFVTKVTSVVAAEK